MFLIKDSGVIKTIGLKIQNSSENNPIGSPFFARFQVASKGIHDQGKALFANGFQLKEKKNLNFAIVWINPQVDMIQIVVQGEMISLEAV